VVTYRQDRQVTLADAARVHNEIYRLIGQDMARRRTSEAASHEPTTRS
jgi:hypothetical protein